VQTLETARLRLRARTFDDLEAIVEMDADEEVCRYIGGPRDRTVQRAKVRDDIVAGRPAPWLAWAIEWKERPGFLGQCTFSQAYLPGTTEIGWRLARAAWGHGIATEAAVALLDLGVDDPRIGPIVALIHPGNRASTRVAEKIGLQHVGETDRWGVRALVWRTPERRILSAFG
jgi:RimJ/RimL family protein N-acetyltransferase